MTSFLKNSFVYSTFYNNWAQLGAYAQHVPFVRAPQSLAGFVQVRLLIL